MVFKNLSFKNRKFFFTLDHFDFYIFLLVLEVLYTIKSFLIQIHIVKSHTKDTIFAFELINQSNNKKYQKN
jgi:hypothetical protein